MSKLKSQNQNLNIKSNLKIRAYQFSLSIIKFVANFLNQKNHLVFRNQLLRSATSIGANIVEAKSSSSKREFIKFYEISLKSANETKYWLCLLRDSSLVKPAKVEEILKEAMEISNMLASSLLTMKGKKI